MQRYKEEILELQDMLDAAKKGTFDVNSEERRVKSMLRGVETGMIISRLLGDLYDDTGRAH